MEAPSGEAVVVDEGQFGSVGADGKLSAGALSPKAIESLNEWVASAQDPVKPAAESLPGKGQPVASAPSPASGANHSPKQDAAGVSSPAAARDEGAAAQSAAGTDKPASGDKQVAEAASGKENAADSTSGKSETGEKGGEKPAAAKADRTPAPPQSPKWEISAGSVTVGDEQWVRLGLGVDVPIWKFGIFSTWSSS
jgi:hypothetical protein